MIFYTDKKSLKPHEEPTFHPPTEVLKPTKKKKKTKKRRKMNRKSS